MTTTEQTLMKIAAKAWGGAADVHAAVWPHPDDLLKRFREIQALADAQLAVIQRRVE